MADGDLNTDELNAIIEGIRDRVRARYPHGSAGGLNVPLPDLMPVIHARDAAEAKVAAIGKVNPRGPGPVNSVIQFMKRQVARALDWHVREQVEFNRASMLCIDALITALNESNRAISALAAEMGHVQELKDMRGHWIEWRKEWERRLSVNEAQFLRSVSELQVASQHRAALTEATHRDLIRSQHSEFKAELDRARVEIQQRLWADLERVRLDYDRLIHSELRILRQRAAASPAASAPAAVIPQDPAIEASFDYLRFAERFRGSEEYVRRGQSFYRPYFEGRTAVLDIGCGRGEFLDLMREAGVPAHGIELSGESVSICRSKGLNAVEADLFAYLPNRSLDGIFCAQVIEHLQPEGIPKMVRLAAGALVRGGLLAIETPNPECLAIFASHFYLDPTHQRPVPPALMVFYLEEAGFGNIEIHRLSPAVESMPSLEALPQPLRETFFGGLDYAILGRKL